MITSPFPSCTMPKSTSCWLSSINPLYGMSRYFSKSILGDFWTLSTSALASFLPISFFFYLLFKALGFPSIISTMADNAASGWAMADLHMSAGTVTLGISLESSILTSSSVKCFIVLHGRKFPSVFVSNVVDGLIWLVAMLFNVVFLSLWWCCHFYKPSLI